MAQLITASEHLDAVVDKVSSADRYAIDTEFHRERTYYPQVALVQLAVHGDVWLIDPLEVDLEPLARLLDGSGLCVIHAATQDLEVLRRACGTVPAQLFDTQIAASFVGLSSASLATLLAKYEGIQLTKSDRLTDWLRRPLTPEQLSYAASDVEHLLSVAAKLRLELQRLGRLDWVDDECRRLLDTAGQVRTTSETLRRIKEARSMKGQTLGVALALVEWRERCAAQLDVPVRTILSDIALVGVAQRAPRTEQQLRNVRGIDGRHLRNGTAAAILEAVAQGLQTETPEPLRPKGSDVDRSLRPVISLITSWVSQIAREQALDPAVLATRRDVEEFLTEGTSSRLDRGWRSGLVGAPIRALVHGEAAIAFDGAGQLVLERRSGDAYVPGGRPAPGI